MTAESPQSPQCGAPREIPVPAAFEAFGCVVRVEVERNAEQEADGERTFDAHTYSLEVAGFPAGALTVNAFPADSVLSGSRGRTFVDGVDIREDLRRRGLATMLFALAEEHHGRIEHSDWLTADGFAWARSAERSRGRDLDPRFAVIDRARIPDPPDERGL